MDPLRTYDYLTLARGRLLDLARPLTPDQYTRPFPIGPGSLARTFAHTLLAEWYYTLRISDRAEPIQDLIAAAPLNQDDPPPLPGLEAAWTAQAARTRAALHAVPDWNTPTQYPGARDGRPVTVTATPADIFTQLALHEVHHRAQAMNILRQLGAQVEDIDFNTLMYTYSEATQTDR